MSWNTLHSRCKFTVGERNRIVQRDLQTISNNLQTSMASATVSDGVIYHCRCLVRSGLHSSPNCYFGLDEEKSFNINIQVIWRQLFCSILFRFFSLFFTSPRGCKTFSPAICSDINTNIISFLSVWLTLLSP